MPKNLEPSFDAIIARRNALAALPPGEDRDRAALELDRMAIRALGAALAASGDLTPAAAERVRGWTTPAVRPVNRVHRQQATLAAALRGFGLSGNEETD
ncbi:hypothetical protein [Segnochrobactrum spirostomi]|uniref:Uncharacterized protein n=1 Tax=Segnochrobactrum spirostomi TaxID=2608987 RepID=A0A6A7Y3U9_9HYPH|nr:hypothetical protein [Segnochrobactrum spirostomi]MQT13395.1 hypothetical protein [Segnochrobactrum spirostomi]